MRGSEAGHATLKPAIRMALADLGLDDAPATAAPSSAFFRQTPQRAAFSVPPSKPYTEELQRCWGDPTVLSHHTSDGRNLAAMQEAGSYGLDRMAPVDPTIASLIVSPDEALRPDARCPHPQCRLTNDLLVRAYNIAARMAWIGNSFSHLILDLSQVLQESGVDSSAQTLSDASLQTFAFMSRELGRLMSTVTLARRQVWLAQSSLSEGCRHSLCSLPVVPGHMFGRAAQQALERSAQVDQARPRFTGLHQGLAQAPRQMVLLPPGPSHSYPPACPGAQLRSSHYLGHYDQRWRSSSLPFFQVPRGPAPRGWPPKGSRGWEGGRPEAQRVGVGRFTQQHISYWERDHRPLGGIHAVQGIHTAVPTPATDLLWGQNVCGQRSHEIPRPQQGAGVPFRQGRHRACRRAYTAQWVLFSVFFNPEEGRRVPPHPGSAGAEQVFKGLAIPHVADGRRSPVSGTGGMVGVNRSQRCLFSCAYCSTPQAFPAIRISGPGLSIQGDALQSLTGPSHIYEVCGSGTCPHTSQGVDSFAISG